MILENGESLAYLGDSVYEVMIRKYLLEKNIFDVNTLHKQAVRYSSGKSQALIIKKMLADNFLTEEEISYFKRGRNANHSANRRQISVLEYKNATGFEAVIGYLELSGQRKRLDEVVSFAINFVESEGI